MNCVCSLLLLCSLWRSTWSSMTRSTASTLRRRPSTAGTKLPEILSSMRGYLRYASCAVSAPLCEPHYRPVRDCKNGCRAVYVPSANAIVICHCTGFARMRSNFAARRCTSTRCRLLLEVGHSDCLCDSRRHIAYRRLKGWFNYFLCSVAP